MKYLIVTKKNEIVCECNSRKERLLCMKELIEMDKKDGTFEKGFYVFKN